MAEKMRVDDEQCQDFPPQFVTADEHLDVLNELIQREPLFHHPELGTERQDFENMTADEFWEIGASGRRYHREYIIADVLKRYENPQYQGIHGPPEDTWKMEDFCCREIASDNYLLTYTLYQGARATRRVTLWQKCPTGWQALYHQGTLVTG